jgi:hypothetical protein
VQGVSGGAYFVPVVQFVLQGGHLPPQSTPVSPWFWIPSAQVSYLPVCVLVLPQTGSNVHFPSMQDSG